MTTLPIYNLGDMILPTGYVRAVQTEPVYFTANQYFESNHAIISDNLELVHGGQNHYIYQVKNTREEPQMPNEIIKDLRELGKRFVIVAPIAWALFEMLKPLYN